MLVTFLSRVKYLPALRPAMNGIPLLWATGSDGNGQSSLSRVSTRCDSKDTWLHVLLLNSFRSTPARYHSNRSCPSCPLPQQLMHRRTFWNYSLDSTAHRWNRKLRFRQQGKCSLPKSSGDLEDRASGNDGKAQFDKLMSDKFIALDQDKCNFVYQLIHAMRATNVVEAGTSFGVSTIYLALAVAQVKTATGKSGTFVATEKETEKAHIARAYWKQCGADVENEIDLRVGDLLQTLKSGLPGVDLLLLDIWSALALPTLKIVQPHLRHGAVVLTDNTLSGAAGYKDIIAYLRAPENGFRNLTLPFTNGFEMSVYLPRS